MLRSPMRKNQRDGTFVAREMRPPFVDNNADRPHMLQSFAPPERFAVAAARHVDEPPLFREWHPHVLLVGNDTSISPALERLRPQLRRPISHWRPAVAADPPRVTSGALIIWGVGTLSLDQQHHLLAWMTGAGANVQIVSISESQLFPRVSQKAFLDDLYYRLNMVCVALDDTAANPRIRLL